jgi:uncharacterized protein YjbJ (UPF0337 family)
MANGVFPVAISPIPGFLSLDSRGPGNTTGMGAEDTAKNRSQQVKGKAKEVVGKATKNKKLEWDGKKDMASGEVKQRGSKLT